LEDYQLLQERQPEIGCVLSCQRMLAFLLELLRDIKCYVTDKGDVCRCRSRITGTRSDGQRMSCSLFSKTRQSSSLPTG